jgi:hypothetical protein
LKRLLALGVLGVAGLAAMAQTCVVDHFALTNTNGENDTFAGELMNDSGADILQHNFVVAFLNDDNEVVETRVVEGCTRSIPNEGTGYFSATSSEPAGDTVTGLARLAFDSTLEFGPTADGDIAISNLVVTRTGTSLVVTGTITNNDNDVLEEPHVCVVVYRDDGAVVITGKDVAINDLDEDESDTFSVTLTVPDSTSTVDEVDVHADGLEDGVPVGVATDDNNDVTVATATPSTPVATNTPAATSTPVATPTVQ